VRRASVHFYWGVPFLSIHIYQLWRQHPASCQWMPGALVQKGINSVFDSFQCHNWLTSFENRLSTRICYVPSHGSTQFIPVLKGEFIQVNHSALYHEDAWGSVGIAPFTIRSLRIRLGWVVSLIPLLLYRKGNRNLCPLHRRDCGRHTRSGWYGGGNISLSPGRNQNQISWLCSPKYNPCTNWDILTPSYLIYLM
jgi:hypothetical protein